MLPPPSERWYSNHPESQDLHRLLCTTVYTLRPNPCTVFNDRFDDDDIQHLREHFDAAQRTAVAQFLGGVLRDPIFADRPMADRAAQAILWCWRDDPITSWRSRERTGGS